MDGMKRQEDFSETRHIVLAGGCFWGLQALMDSFKGIRSTVVGYANAHAMHTANESEKSSSIEAQAVPFLKNAKIPTCQVSYKEICSGQTGAVEAVAIEYDGNVIKLEDILNVFFSVIDPTSKNFQGNDVGTQYRSGVYYLPSDKDSVVPVVEKKIKEIQTLYKRPIVTELAELKKYSIAEEIHQKYLENRPGGYCHINISAAKEKFAHLL